MMINRNRFVTLTLALVAVLGLLISTVLVPRARADTVDDTTSQTLLAVNGVTTTQTGADAYTQFYGAADCYGTLRESADVSNVQTVTAKLQHSPDTLVWVDLDTLAAQGTDASTAFTSTVPRGAYTRVLVTPLTNTVAFTYTMKCTLKDTHQ